MLQASTFIELFEALPAGEKEIALKAISNSRVSSLPIKKARKVSTLKPEHRTPESTYAFIVQSCNITTEPARKCS